MKNDMPPKDEKQLALSRRSFMKVAGAGVVAADSLTPVTAQSAFQAQLTALPAPKRLSENLYLIEDTCNVYLVRDGRRALLVDFGSGFALRIAPQLGISKLDLVLHTHHHRDQAQGDLDAFKAGIKIFVPARERHLFEDAENFWRNRQIYHLYAVRNDFFTLTRNVRVAGVLEDYETFSWGPCRFLILPTPGHTAGSISLVATIDGKKVAFTGDVIHSPGKIQNLYDLQYYYGGHEGADFLVHSLDALMQQNPQLVCPSHGDPMEDPARGLQDLSDKLADWVEFWPNLQVTARQLPQPVSPHLIAHPQATSAFYVVISDSGKALFVDYGSAGSVFFRTFREASGTFDRIRFVEHSITALKARHGLKSIEVAMPSHIHDDHINGFPYLARRYGTKIWCYENMVEILENPRGRNVGCVLAEPVKVDLSFRHKEQFKWEEFEFTVVHSPGHTDFQMAMFATIDGTRVAFTGDAFFARNPNDPQEAFRHNLIYRNDVQSDSHLHSLRNIMEFEPQLIAPGHGAPFFLAPEDLKLLEKRFMKQQQHFQSLIADPDTDFGLDPSWVHIYPYQASILPGQSRSMQMRIRNHGSRPMKVEAAPVLPPGWSTTPAVLDVEVPAKGTTTTPFVLSVPAEYPASLTRVAITLDVIAGGKYLGQIAESVVELKEFNPKSAI